MSKIDDLIKELCPDGMRFVRVGDVAVIGTGRSDRKDAVENGQYPFYVRSKIVSRIDRYSFDEEAIIIPGEGGVGDIFHYVNGKYDLHQRAYRIVFTTDEVNTKYALYYFMSHFKSFITLKAVNATVTSIRKPMIEDFPIPIPPLEVQKEIVRVLDSFTELEAELEARKKQYEYYRNTLLTFNERENKIDDLIKELCPKGVKYERIKDVYSRLKGTPITAGKMKEIANPDGDIRVFAGGRTVIDAFEFDIPNANITKVPAVLVQSRGVIDVVYYDKPFTFKNEMWAYTHNNQDSIKYLYYVLKNHKEYLRNAASGMGSLPQISLKVTEELKIPIPPLEKQKQIVSILDKFDALVNDISIGLPAEIEARRKQYEYYRNELLTFKELERSK